jgi:hypothetical protein
VADALSESRVASAEAMRFPRFARRIRALWIDTVVFVLIYLAWILGLDWLYQFPPPVRIAALLVPVLLLEPALVAWSGGTLGHHAVGIRVRDARADRRIGLARACGRAAFKATFGWASLMFALVGHRHQAAHDLLTRSLLVLKNPDRLPPSEVLESRIQEALDFRYPPPWRRVAAIFAWWIGATTAYVLALSAIGALGCVPRRGCGPWTAAVIVLNLTWTLSVLTIPAFGWYGRLRGARRVRDDAAPDRHAADRTAP